MLTFAIFALRWPVILLQLEDHDNDESILADQPYIRAYTVQDLYLFMGKELEAMDQVPAGNLLGGYYTKALIGVD